MTVAANIATSGTSNKDELEAVVIELCTTTTNLGDAVVNVATAGTGNKGALESIETNIGTVTAKVETVSTENNEGFDGLKDKIEAASAYQEE